MKKQFHKSFLMFISLIVLIHSTSLYLLHSSDPGETDTIEMTQGDDEQQLQLQAYDALIPTLQGMAPLVLYFLNEVVLLSEAEYQERPPEISFENHLLEVLFPLIISPNAP